MRWLTSLWSHALELLAAWLKKTTSSLSALSLILILTTTVIKDKLTGSKSFIIDSGYE